MSMPGYDLFGSVYKKGEPVFQEGEQGDSMFIIQSGAVEVTKTAEDREVVLAQLEQGEFFGEMALIDAGHRSATVRTLCKSRILPLSKNSLLARIPEDPGIVLYILGILSRRIAASNKVTMTSLTEAKGKQNEARADQNAIPDEDNFAKKAFRPEAINTDTYTSIFSALDNEVSVEFDAEEIIFRQGDEGREMFVIREGTVEIRIEDDNGSVIIATMGPGDCLGEMAVISETARSATAVAIEKTRTVKIDRQTFLDRLKAAPEIGFSLIQLMILRLRRTINGLSARADEAETPGIVLQPLFKKDRKIRLSLLSLSACSGCIINILEERTEFESILDMTKIIYSPMLMDNYDISQADIAVIDGAVRNREERELLENVRSRSRYLVAWGTCAAFTGVPAYANSSDLEDLIDESYGHTEDPYAHYLAGKTGSGSTTYRDEHLALLRKAGKLDDFVKVDYFLPGCPPRISLLTDLIRELRGEKKKNPDNKLVCSECSRKRTKCAARSLSAISVGSNDRAICFNSQGLVCLGFLTRGNCGAPCPEGGLPCWGCRGPSDFALRKINSGISFENLLTDSLKRTCKISHEEVAPAVNTLGSRCISMSRFDHYFIYDSTKIR